MATKRFRRFRRRLILLLLIVGVIFVWYKGNDFRYPTKGIDISHHQGEIDWDKVSADGVDFVFMKATEGQDFLDDKFSYNWEEAKRVDIPRGAYHFFLPSVDAEKQAQNFIRTVKMEPGDLPPVLDIEVTNHKSREEIIRGATIWLEKVEAHYGVKPLIYASPSYYNNYLDASFDKYPLWLAHHYRFSPRAPERREDWNFWQSTNFGFVKGIKGNVDVNYFRKGKLEEWGYAP